jgi:hypothetical protein
VSADLRSVIAELIERYRGDLIVRGEWDRGRWSSVACYDRKGYDS